MRNASLDLRRRLDIKESSPLCFPATMLHPKPVGNALIGSLSGTTGPQRMRAVLLGRHTYCLSPISGPSWSDRLIAALRPSLTGFLGVL